MKAKLVKHVCRVVALSLTLGTMFVNGGIVANAQPKVMKDGTVFDAEYYAQRYADVVAVYGTKEAALFKHYSDYGKAENREAVQAPDVMTFDFVFYAQQNPDVVAVYGNGSNNLYQHYLQYGKKEGRKAVANEVATPKAVTEQSTASTQKKTISDAEAKKIFEDYLSNIVSYTPESVCAFFDVDKNMTIDGDEMIYLIAWTADSYNTVDKTKITEDEMIAVGHAMHNGTFKLPSAPYYVNLG